MKMGKPVLFLVVLLLLITNFFPIFSYANSPLGLPPKNGDWVVNDSTYINDTTIELNGNLSITNSGYLELKNTTLIMNGNITVEGDFILRNVTLIMNITINLTDNMSSPDGYYGITVETSGLMYILDQDSDPNTNDSTIIRSTNIEKRFAYTFWVKSGAQFKIENSIIQDCGFGSYFPGYGVEHEKGLFIETSNVQIRNSTINNSVNGIIFNSTSSMNNKIINCTVARGANSIYSRYGYYGLIFTRSSYNLVRNCFFEGNRYSLFLYYSNNNFIIDNIFQDTVKQIEYERVAYGIFDEYSTNNVYLDNKILKYSRAIELYNSNNTLIKNQIIIQTYLGFTISYHCRDISLVNIEIKDLFHPKPEPNIMYPAGIHFRNINTDINITNCSIRGSSSPYTIGIWFDSPTDSKRFNIQNCTIKEVDISLSCEWFFGSTIGTISEVTIIDSEFFGRLHSLRTVYELVDWKFSNCTFKKVNSTIIQGFEIGVFALHDNINELYLDNCQLITNDTSNKISGLLIANYYSDMLFEININNTLINNMSNNGITVNKQSYYLGGMFNINNSKINENRGYGIYSSDTDLSLKINNSNLSNNNYNGIYLNNLKDSEILINNSNVSWNNDTGMAIYTVDSDSTINIINTEICNNSFNGLLVFNSKNTIQVSKTDLLFNSQNGIDLYNTEAEINGCNLSANSENGIYILTGTGILSNNLFMKNGFEGIRINNTNDILFIERNLFSSNGETSGSPQIQIIDSPARISNNTITTDHDISSIIGLQIINSDNVELFDNVFSGDFVESVIEIENSEVLLKRNAIFETGPISRGIFGHGISNSIQLIDNTLTAFGKYGILISSGMDTVLYNNTISNWVVGVTFSNISATMEKNIIQDTTNCGVHVKESATMTLNDNKFIRNNNGIILDGTGYLVENEIIKSGGIGIWITELGSGSISTNTIIRNHFGVLIEKSGYDSDNNVFSNNDIAVSMHQVSDVVLNNDWLMENNVGIKAVDSNFRITKYSFDGNNKTLELSNSICKLLNSTVKNSDKSNFKLENSSHCQIINTNTNNISADIRDNRSLLEQQWYLNLTIVNTDNQTLADTNVHIMNKDDHKVFSGVSSKVGEINQLNLTSEYWIDQGEMDPNPYRVIISKKNYGTTVNELYFQKNTNVTFTAYKLSELITQISAKDVPNDEGGAIFLSWSSIPILNFGHYNIYVDNEYITSISTLDSFNSSITDQSTNSIVISEINGQPLINGEKHYFTVTVVDLDGNEDFRNVLSSNAVIPIDNLSPKPIKNLTAYDTPNDNGGSITITWAQSHAVDFDHYSLYYINNPVTYYTEANISQLPIKSLIKNQTFTNDVLKGLTDGVDYYFFILVYDINGNVNLSYQIIGPINCFDNIPPKIDRNRTTPKPIPKVPQDGGLSFYANEGQIFRIFLTSGEDVYYEWYLDEEFIEDIEDEYYFLNMVDLELGEHNLTIYAIEPSGLNDTVSWEFSVLNVPPDDPIITSSAEDNFWIVLVIILISIVVVFLYTARSAYRYNEARTIIKTVPELNDTRAISLINQKREKGDRYTLNKLVSELPKVLEDNPNKLFMLLNLLALDDSSDVRENAAKNIGLLMEANPHKVFQWLKLLQGSGLRAESYQTISNSIMNKKIQAVVKSLYYSLTAKSGEESQYSLENASFVLKESQDLKYGMEISAIYEMLNEFYKFRTVSKISTSKPNIDKILKLRTWATDILYPETIEIFDRMYKVADTLGKYEKVDSVEDKLSYLSLALNFIEEASRISREQLLRPESDLFLLVLDSWRNIISISIRELRGRADLSFNLIGKETNIDQETMTLMLELKNRGRSVAERLLVELVPADDYVVLTPPQELGSIGATKGKELTFKLKPKSKEKLSFRIEFAIHYDDAEKKEKSVSFGDLVSRIKVGAEFIEIPNPYIVGTPIKTGSKLFVGRGDLIDFIQKNIRGSLQENIIVLIGHRRTGKTTLLKQLPIYLDNSYVPVYIDIQGIIDPGMDAFFYLIATEIVSAMTERGFEIEQPEFDQFKERPSYHFEYEFLKKVYETLGDSILILMFDEFEELEVKVDSGLLNKNIFSYLRHLMQHTKQLAFIFTGSLRLEDLKTDYWSIMFNIAIYKRISFLSEPETKELITEPVKKYNMVYDPLALEKIYRLTHGHPYFTQLLCHALVNLHNSDKKNYITIQEVDQELNRIIERGQMHFDFIWDQASLKARLVMTCLSRLLREGEESITASSIVNKLAEYNIVLDSATVTKKLDSLSNKDIVEKILDHTTTYEFKVDLIRIWLERTKQLDQVVDEYKSEN